MQKSNWFKPDDVEVNKLWGFDYTFCHNDCQNKECGRNNKSKSYKYMMDYSEGRRVYSATDLSSVCIEYKKGEEECASQT